MLNASFPCNKLKIWPWSYPTTKRPNTTITAKKPIANFVLSYSATLVFCLDKDIKFFLRIYYIKSWMVYPTSNLIMKSNLVLKMERDARMCEHKNFDVILIIMIFV